MPIGSMQASPALNFMFKPAGTNYTYELMFFWCEYRFALDRLRVKIELPLLLA